MIDGEDDEDGPIEVQTEDDGASAAEHSDGDKSEGGEEAAFELKVEGYDDLEAETPEDTPLIKQLRQAKRDASRREREKDERIRALEAASAPKPVELGPEPTLESCDFDEDLLKQRHYEWKRANERQVDQRQSQINAQAAAEAKVTKAKADMRVNALKFGRSNFDEIEEAVAATLAPAVLNVIALEFGAQAPVIIMAMHQHPELVDKYNGMITTNPIRAIIDLANLAKGVKMVPKRKTGAQAEEIVRGSASLAIVPADKKQAELEKAVDAGKPGAQQALMAFLKGKRKAAATAEPRAA